MFNIYQCISETNKCEIRVENVKSSFWCFKAYCFFVGYLFKVQLCARMGRLCVFLLTPFYTKQIVY